MARFKSIMRTGAALVAVALAVAGPAEADVRLPAPGYVFEAPSGCDRPQRGVRLYDDCADQVAVFTRARAEAYGGKKQLVVVFGANWCPSCRSLKPLLDGGDIQGRLFKGETLSSRVHVVDIALSRLHDGRTIPVPSGQAVLRAITESREDVAMRAIPFLAVLDPVTGRVSARNLDDLQGPRGWNAAAVATVIAAAETETRGGARAPGEPGWLRRKWLRWFGP